MTLSDHSMCMIPHQNVGSPLSSLFLIRLFVEFRVGNEKKHTCFTYIAKSKTGSNRENMSYNQINMCMCVEFSGWNSHPFLHDSIFYFEIWAIFLFLFSFSFSYAFGHGYFFFSFRIAHILFAI